MGTTKDVLADFTAEAARRKPGIRRRVDVILEQLDDDRRAALLAALADERRFSAHVVSTVVTGWGWHLSSGAVRTWRAGNGER
jgi:hypothetical protein